MSTRIIVIDDDADILELFSITLQDEGYEVHLREFIFEDPAEAEHLAPNLIIVDLLLGYQQNGWGFLQRLKSHPPTASIPLILCTAARLTSEQESYLQQQGIPIMFKPFELDELHQLVRHLVSSQPVHMREYIRQN
jgi:DNA-binding response OmpR family regulator